MPPVDIRVGGEAGRARSSFVPTAVPQPDIGVGFRAVTDLMTDLSDMQRDIDAQNDEVSRIQREQEWQVRVEEGKNQLDPTAPDYMDQLEALHTDITADVVGASTFKTPEAGETLERNLAQYTRAGTVHAVGVRQKAVNDRAETVATEMLVQTEADIRRDPDGADAYTVRMRAQAEALLRNASPEVQDAFRRTAADRIILAQVEGLAQNRRDAEANALLTDAEGELDPQTARFTRRMVREIENQHRNDFLAETNGMMADFAVAIEDAGDMKSLLRLRQESDRMERTGLYEGREGTRITHVKAIDARRRELVKGAQDLSVAAQEFAADLGFSSDKNADLYYENILEPQLEGLSPEDRLARIDHFVDRGRRIPSRLKNVIEMSELGDNVGQIASAAQMDQHFSLIVPGIDTGAGDRTNMVQALMKAGFDPNTAAEMAINQSPDPATSQRRIDDYNDRVEAEAFDPREFIADNTDAIGPGFWGAAAAGLGLGFGFEGPRVTHIPEDMASEIGEMRKEYYRMSGNMKWANDAALRFIDRNYGVTEVGGRPRFERLPPERQLPVDWEMSERTRFLNLLTEEVIAAAGQTIPEQPDLDLFGREIVPYDLVADRNTETQGYLVRIWSGVGDVMRPVWYDTPGGRREQLRLPVPTLEQMQRTQAWQIVQQESEARATAARDRQAIAGAATGVAAQLGGAAGEAITEIPRTAADLARPVARAIGETGAEAVRRHPFRGFLARQRQGKR